MAGMMPEADQKLRQALGMMRAAERLLHRAMGAQVLARGWQPGRPLPEQLQRVHAAHECLRQALETLNQAVQEDPAGRRSPGGAEGRRPRRPS